MIIHYTLRRGQPLTPEQEKRLDALSEMSDDDIVYDEYSPKLTDEELKEFRRVNPRKKENQKIAS